MAASDKQFSLEEFGPVAIFKRRQLLQVRSDNSQADALQFNAQFTIPAI